MLGHVYVIQPDDIPLYKLGSTTHPIERLAGMQAQSPHRMRFRKVLRVESWRKARAFERFTMSHLKDTLAHGEWFSDLPLILDLFETIAPAVDVTDEYPPAKIRNPFCKRPWSLEELAERLAQAGEDDAVRGPVGKPSYRRAQN